MERLMGYGSVRGLISTNKDGENFFRITSEEKQFLDLLMLYRQGENVDLLDYSYNKLKHVLSKLIFIYLDLMINMRYSNLSMLGFLADKKDTLRSLFEFYVMNEAHRLIKNWQFLIDIGLTSLYPERVIIDVTKEIYQEMQFTTDVVPLEELTIYLNGEIQNISDLEITLNEEEKTLTVSWFDSIIEVEEGDAFVLETLTDSPHIHIQPPPIYGISQPECDE